MSFSLPGVRGSLHHAEGEGGEGVEGEQGEYMFPWWWF
jgi:hypothetical protein